MSWSQRVGIAGVLVALVIGCEASPSDAPIDAAVPARDALVVVDAPSEIDASAPPAPCPCFDGDGAYCESAVATRAADEGCVVEGALEGGARIFTCDASVWSAGDACADGCDVGESGASASCALPECECFVRSAWCGASAARHGLTLDPPCRVPLAAEHDDDILACDGPTWIVRTACEEGCHEAPTGTPDACNEDRGTPADPGWPDCPHRALIHAGVHPEASDRLRCAGVTAGIITQTIGNAAASAGYHASDGTADGMAYTAAIDLSVRGLSEAEIRALLERLGTHGFAAWYRKPGSDGWPAGQAPHIHAVFAGVRMKSELRSQVRDFLVGRNGLASHSEYRFWRPSAAILETVRLLYSRNYTPP